MVRELFALAVEVRKEKDLPWFRVQQWYFYGTAVFFTYGRFLKAKVATQIASDANGSSALGLSWFLVAHHSLMSYLGWMFGFVLFVLSLRKGLYVYQFGQFAWTHMIIATVLLQSSCFVANVLDGLIWFVFPVAIVFFNDIAAYLCGFFFGRTPLIQISPKKTWEGFIGGFAITLAVSPFAAAWLQRYKWLVCPSAAPLRLVGGSTECEADPLFVMTEVPVASVVEGLESVFGVLRWMVPHGWVAQAARGWFGLETVRASWFQVHAVVFASFASLIAPFGGFFASGFKRAFKIKDFSDTIPGHGGVVDRMDCQMVMAVFSHLYITNFIRKPGLMSLGQLLLKVELLTNDRMLELYKAVGNMILARGLKLP
jgi:phosphatidate cytidylyltransferase